MALQRDRIGGALAAVLVQATLFLGLWLGLVVVPTVQLAAPSITYVTPIAAPKPAPVPKRARAIKPKGAASPPARRAIATPLVVPPPVIPVVDVPPVVAAAVAHDGAQVTSGSATAGPGQGSGGVGEGVGSGDSGAGAGGGGAPAEWLKGRIRDSDYPEAAIIGQVQGMLVTRYAISARGRVTDCTIVQSSGSPVLDETTCRLIKQRFRYRPARDADGHAVADSVEEEHRWIIAPAPPD